MARVLLRISLIRRFRRNKIAPAPRNDGKQEQRRVGADDGDFQGSGDNHAGAYLHNPGVKLRASSPTG